MKKTRQNLELVQRDLQVFEGQKPSLDTYPTTLITVTVLPTVPTLPTRSGGSDGRSNHQPDR